MISRYKSKKNILFCDFETNSSDSEKMVYAWLLKDISNYECAGVSIQSFLDNLWKLPFKTKKVLKMLFHNGSTFDFHFIVSALSRDKRFQQRPFIESKKLIEYLRESDYRRKNTLRKRPKAVDGDYEVLVDGTGKIFQIIIYLKINKVMRFLYFQCAYLTFSYPLSVLGETLNKCGFKLQKGEIDFKDRHYKNVSELKKDKLVYQYLNRDVDILKHFWLEYTHYVPYQHQELTAASTAWWDWLLRSKDNLEKIHKQTFGDCWTYGFISQKKGGKIKKYFWNDKKKAISPKFHLKKIVSQLFPKINHSDVDYIRNWYNGGLTTLNWGKMGLVHKNVTYFDINSAYPNAMMKSNFPIGKPIRRAKKGYDFKLIEVHLLSDCTVKKNNLSFIFIRSIKGSKFYLRTLPKNEVIYLTGEEFLRFKKTYKGKFSAAVKYSFKTVSGEKLFGTYINYWYAIKKEKKNPILTLVAKLMLNSLYGKFGTKNRKDSKVLNPEKVKNWDNNQLSFTKWEMETAVFESTHFLPIGVKITADVRLKLVETVGENYSKFLYADTDSIAFSDNHKIKTGADLGEWKIESENVEMLVAGKKRYLMMKNNQVEKLAFASYKLKKIKDEISFDSFIWGKKHIPHLHKKEVQHGVILNEGEKEIKEIWSADYERSPDCWFKNKQEYYANRPVPGFKKKDIV